MTKHKKIKYHKLYTFIGVQYNEDSGIYSYLTNQKDLAVGDIVVVPVFANNVEKPAKVAKITVCTAKNAPYPIEKTKKVLRKGSAQDVLQYEKAVQERKEYLAEIEWRRAAMPLGYYDEIDNPMSKLQDILTRFQKYNPVVHTNKEKEYHAFEDNEVSIELVGEEESLFIDISDGRFTLFFGGWHAHYSPYEYDYKELLGDVEAFLASDIGAVCLEHNGEWYGCALLNEYTDDESLQAFVRDTFKTNAKPGTTVKLTFWQKDKCSTTQLLSPAR